MNRVGDWGFSIGLWAIFWTFGNLDFTTVFSLAPFINEELITIISICLLVAAMGKSAQIGLHTWLPDAMEGSQIKRHLLELVLLLILLIFIILESIDCSILACSILPFCKNDKIIPSKFLDPMIGELLGDGSITFPGKLGNNARFVITIGINNYPYLLHLRYNVYKDLCTETKPMTYPNPDKTGKLVQQHWFGTKSLLAFTNLHGIWYINKQSGKSQYTKIVPININEMLKPIGLAHWIMGDGY